jgi:hypothetical protein
MSKFTVYDTICLADMQALAEASAAMAISFDATHAGNVKPVHLEVHVQIDADQIARLQHIRHETATKFRLGVLFKGGVYKFECLHFEEDIVRASQKEAQIRRNRAAVSHGGVGEMVSNVHQWK